MGPLLAPKGGTREPGLGKDGDPDIQGVER